MSWRSIDHPPEHPHVINRAHDFDLNPGRPDESSEIHGSIEVVDDSQGQKVLERGKRSPVVRFPAKHEAAKLSEQNSECVAQKDIHDDVVPPALVKIWYNVTVAYLVVFEGKMFCSNHLSTQFFKLLLLLFKLTNTSKSSKTMLISHVYQTFLIIRYLQNQAKI